MLGFQEIEDLVEETHQLESTETLDHEVLAVLEFEDDLHLTVFRQYSFFDVGHVDQVAYVGQLSRLYNVQKLV